MPARRAGAVGSPLDPAAAGAENPDVFDEAIAARQAERAEREQCDALPR
jgi:hypothetical protein